MNVPFLISAIKNEHYTLLHRKTLHSMPYYVWPTSLREGPFIKKQGFFSDHFLLLDTGHPPSLMSDQKLFIQGRETLSISCSGLLNGYDLYSGECIFKRTVCNLSGILMTSHLSEHLCQSNWVKMTSLAWWFYKIMTSPLHEWMQVWRIWSKQSPFLSQ